MPCMYRLISSVYSFNLFDLQTIGPVFLRLSRDEKYVLTVQAGDGNHILSMLKGVLSTDLFGKKMN